MRNPAENRRLVAAFRDGGDRAAAFQRRIAKQNARRLALRAKGRPSSYKVGA
jgi:hypothetical protein